MKAYLFNSDTKEFEAEIEAQIDPLESKEAGKNIYLLPANATFEEPLEVKDGFKVVWNNISWVYKKIPEPVIEEEKPLTIEEQNEAIRATREMLYTQTSDKIKADYDEAVARGSENAEQLKQEWLASKDKIRQENPYIE